MTPAQLLDLIPDSVRYRRRSIPEGENALIPWQQAVNILTPGDHEDGTFSELIYGTDDGKRAELPPGEDRERMKDLVNSNQRAFGLIEEGLARGAFQLPELTDFNQAFVSTYDIPTKLNEVSELRLIQTALHRAEGNTEAAADDLLMLLRMGEMVCNGDVLVSSYLLGSMSRKRASCRLISLIEEHPLPNHTRRSLRESVEQSLDIEDGLALSERVDFCSYTIPKFSLLQEDADLESLVDQLVDAYYDKQTTADWSPEDFSDEQISDAVREQRTQTRRQQILEILDGHPHPFDKRDTIRMAGGYVAERVSFSQLYDRDRSMELRDIWNSFILARFRDRQQSKVNRVWPAALSVGFSFDLFGEDPKAEARRLEVQPHMDPKDYAAIQPLTPKRLVEAKHQLRRVKNPVGIMLQPALCSIDVRNSVVEYRGQLRQIRDMLEADN